jgi:uncharacterized membrane protein YdbT with pleckstrin-like domain
VSWVGGMIPQPQVGSHLLREEGEVIVDEVLHHWVAYTKSCLYAAVGLALVVVALYGPVDLSAIFLIGGGLVLVWAGYLAMDVHMDRFVVTNMRVFRVQGVFGQSLATMPLTRILDITVNKPLLGRLLGYGNFVFESAAQAQGLRDISHVPRPDERDLIIQRVVQRSGLRGRQVN